MKDKKLLIYMPTSQGLMRVETSAWIAGVCGNLSVVECLKQVSIITRKNSRIALSRNIAATQALHGGFDYLMMVDPDMVPDYYTGKLDCARPFIPSALKVIQDNPYSIVGAPYCSNRPDRQIHVWFLNEEYNVCRYSHSQAAERIQNPIIEKIVAIGTGLLLIDCKVFEKIEQPWFFDEYYDKAQIHLTVSQDINFTHKATTSGCNVWCNWYAYSGHIQSETLGCPELTLESDLISDVEAMSKESLDKLKEILDIYVPLSILEVGPGRSTLLFKEYCQNCQQVKHHILAEQSEWLDQFDSFVSKEYSLVDKLFSSSDRNLFRNLPPVMDRPYDLILIDGPMGDGRNTPELRSWLERNVNGHAVVIIDDIDRIENQELVDFIVSKKNKRVETVQDSMFPRRHTAFLFPEEV